MMPATAPRLFEYPAARVGLCALVLLAGATLPGPLRAAVTLPLILLLPGYATVIALRLPRSRRDVLPAPLLWLIVSMAVIPLTLLGLHFAGMPLKGGWILTAIGGYCVLAALAAPRQAPLSQVPSAATLRGAAALAGVLALGAAIIAFGLHVLPGAPADDYSMLALSGRWAQVSKPVVVAPQATTTVDVTITNTTGATHHYTLLPHVKHTSWPAVQVTVPADQTWHGSVAGTIPAGGCLHRLIVRLNEDGEPSPIEGLTVWFQSTPKLSTDCTVKAVDE